MPVHDPNLPPQGFLAAPAEDPTRAIFAPSVRMALYVLTLLGAPVVVYLRARGIIGDLELALWGAEVTAVSTLAAFNVPSTKDAEPAPVPAPEPVAEPAPLAAPVKKTAAKRPAKKAAPKPPTGLS
jgi:hypothetical protein